MTVEDEFCLGLQSGPMVGSLVERDIEVQLIDRVLFGRTNAVAFVGPTGIGTSVLLDAAADRAAEIGVPVSRAYGSPAMSDIPFGAVSHLLRDGVQDTASLLRSVERDLVAAGNGGGVAFIVDDCDALDQSTLALLHALAAGKKVGLILAVTDDVSVPIALSRMWRDGLVRRHDVAPLARSTTRALVERHLGDAISDDAERTIWTMTAGHPLYLDLIVGSDAFTHHGHLWRLDRDPAGDRRIAEVVDPWIDAISPDARRALAALAWENPMEFALIESVAGVAATAELESAGLARTVDGATWARHPIHAAVARSRITTRERRAIVRELAATLWGRGDLDGVDLIRAVRWQLEAGEDCDASALVGAARRALSDGDYEAAEYLGRVGVDRVTPPDNWEPALALAQALRQHGDGAGAERAFEIAATAPTDADRVNVAVARSHNLALVCGRFDDALKTLAATSSTIHDPDLVRRIALERTFLSAVVGDFREIASASRELVADPDLDDLTAITAANGLTFASIMLLRVDSFDHDLEQLRPAASRLESVLPLAVDQLDLITAVARVAQGRVVEAIESCVARRARGMDDAWGTGDGSWTAIETFARTLRADPSLATVARRALVGLRSVDPMGLRYVGSGIAAIALMQAGFVDEADAAIEAASPPSSEGDRRSGILIEARVAAWRAALAGDVDEAARLVSEAATTAVEFGHLLWGMLGLHDAVRFGRPQRVRAQLHALRDDEGAEGALLDAVCAHADAAAANDADELVSTVDRFVRIGATLFAVEAAVQASALLADRGDRLASVRVGGRALVIAGGVLPPTPACGAAPASLTERQTEIVAALIDGRTARDIADELSLSVRTIENHIAAAHRALGVSNRRELVDVLAPTVYERHVS